MSVIINGMEMPKSCYSCNFCQYYAEPNQGCYCLALFVDLHRTNFVKERLANCPLIEVPPHGRLIDAEALLESIKEAKKKQPEISDVYDEDYFAVAEWVAYAPTVIEVEPPEREE